MRSGRDVQFSAILLSCVAVLCHRAGAFGTGYAVGLPACTTYDTRPTCLSPWFSADVNPWASLPADGLRQFSDLNVPRDTMSAAALLDRPGAVCLGVLGFVCVSLVRSRRIWIGLCLCMLSHGRVSAARLSKIFLSGPDRSDPDVLRESDPEPFLRCESARRGCRLSDLALELRSRVPGMFVFEPGVRYPAYDRFDNDLYSTRQPSLAQAVIEEFPLAPSIDIGWDVMDWLASYGCVQWARPPPEGAQTIQDEKELSSDFHLLAQQRR